MVEETQLVVEELEGFQEWKRVQRRTNDIGVTGVRS